MTEGQDEKPQEIKFASRVKDIWFNDKYATNTLPHIFPYDEIVLSGTIEEAAAECRILIAKSFKLKKLTVDMNYVFFDMLSIKIRNNHIKWTDIKQNTRTIKYVPETQQEQTLPEILPSVIRTFRDEK
jgi:hypothetical protein